MLDEISGRIAIVGIGLRLPGNIVELDDLWSVLAEGRNCWTTVPKDRYNENAYLHPDSGAPTSHNHRGGHFLSQDVAAFDAGFFHVPPAEAQAMDPQQRILLETTYDAFQSCGSTLESIRGSNTAVYIATFSSDYDRIIQKDISDIPKYHTTGTGEAIAANRISHAFDLKGPSVALDTGCSGSLVAVHYACQSLITGEVEMAIAGGVNLILNPDRMLGMANLGMLNADGRSYSFDQRGAGYGRGEGSVVVILKSLDEAIRCGDPIRGIIRSTAVNQDGKTSGITLPSQVAQEMLLRRAYAKQSLDPQAIHYVEAHGTGTSAGDLAEIGAIAEVFCRNRTTPLYVGSIKSAVGHLEGASGLAGLVKAVLIVEKGIIPPNADFQSAKPELDLHGRNIIIPVKREPFPKTLNRIVSVNSFGYGGTNAHVILENAPSIKYSGPLPEPCLEPYVDDQISRRELELPQPRLFILSARSESSLRATVRKLYDWVSTRKDSFDLDNLAYTLLTRRSRLEWRCSFVADHRTDLLKQMEEKTSSGKMQRSLSKVGLAYIFTGQGAQWYAMGRGLMTTSRVFKESLAKSASIIRELGASWDLIDELILDETKSRINEIWLSQPATTAVQIALVDILRDFGLQPHIVIGHSSGEIAAAYAAGYLSQQAAIQVSYYRGLICKIESDQACVKGAMLVVGLSEEETLDHIRQLGLNSLSIACINSPISITVSGEEKSIEKLHEQCQASSLFSRKLNTGIAYHSSHVHEASIRYRKCLSGLDVITSEGLSTFISSVTARPMNTGFGPDYWASNLISRVRFADAVSKFCDLQSNYIESTGDSAAHNIVVEIGPHSALSSAVRQTVERATASFHYSYAPSLVRGKSASSCLLRLIGQLHEYGIPVDLDKVSSMNLPKSLPEVIHDLPSYPWNHSQRYWHESRASRQSRFRKYAPHFLLGTQTNTSTPLEPCWKNIIGADDLPWLQDHVVDNLKVLPGAAYICMAIEAARQHFADLTGLTDVQLVLTNVNFLRVLVIPEPPGKLELYLSLIQPLEITKSSTSMHREFRISSSVNDGPWNVHCNGLIAVHDIDDKVGSNVSTPAVNNDGLADSIASKTEVQSITLSTEDLYHQLDINGNRYGPAFKRIKQAQIDNLGRIISSVEVSNISEAFTSGIPYVHSFHPTSLDAVFHTSLPLYAQRQGPGFVMPTSIACLQLWLRADQESSEQLRVEASLEPQGLATARADIVALDDKLQASPVIRVSGIYLRGTSTSSQDGSHAQHTVAKTLSLMEYEPDSDFLSLSAFKTSPSTAASDDHLLKVKSLNHAALRYVRTSNAKLQEAFRRFPESHLQHFKTWMENLLINPTFQGASDRGTNSSDEPLIKNIRGLGVEGELVCRVGESLTSIMLGGIRPVDLMFKDDLMYNFYADGPSSQCVSSLSEYLEYLTFKRPNMNILEVGAGTASTSVQVLASLTKSGSVHRVGHYVFTDISPGFFEKARKKLADWKDLVSFKSLDISENPFEQGFEGHSFDLIIASNVLHATASIKDTLTNIRKILRPDGKLAIIEVTQPQPFLSMVFGTLPGWWLGIEDGRIDHPLLTQDGWEKALLGASFTGLDVVVQDFEGPAQTSSLMITSVAVPTQSNATLSVEIVTSDESHSHGHALALRLCSQLRSDGLQASVTTWQSFQYTADIVHLIFDCDQDPILLNPTPARFSQIVELLTRPANIFWLSRSFDERHHVNPETALITGLARSAHAENSSLRLVTLDVQDSLKQENSSGFLSDVSKVVSRSFSPASNYEVPPEREYIYRDSIIHIPRILPSGQLDQWPCSKPGWPASFSLDSNSSYLIAGGLGDIGMRVCRIMARHGAGHIIVLSRRQKDVDVARNIETSLKAISPNVKFHWRTCDISVEQQVQECIEGLSQSEIPGVKGVVQAALVLKDKTLSHTSSSDFSLHLKAKVYGTRFLHAAFEKSKLDFFVMLSSISGIVGTSGQASYAASNAFQDAFARSRSKPHYPCISLDLPLMQDSKIKSTGIEQNLESHGTTAITSDMLNCLLEYAMSPHSAQDQYKQVIAGITPESMAGTKVANANANSAMFSHFRSLVRDESTPKSPKPITNVKELLLSCRHADKIHQLLVAAITEKLSYLVVIDGPDSERDLSIAELGMDSLIMVELRNWISTELQAPIHVSEILDQTSIRTLAHLVASRSALVQHSPDDLTHKEERATNKFDIDTEQETQTTQPMKPRADTEKLLELPLPDLSTSLDMYLESRRFLLSPPELEHLKNLIAEFSEVDGPGRRLQDRLNARLHNPTIENWLAELYSRKIYLERRDPIHPYGTFYGGHLLTETEYSQVEKAATIATAALDFKIALETETLERDYLNGDPLCMQSLNWLFNAVREPGLGLDRISKWSECEYMVVLRRGHIFKVALMSPESKKISYWEIRSALESILIRSMTEHSPVAALTADERNSWAELRQHVKTLNETNANTLDAIERAAFVICLDEGRPRTASERCNQFFLGDPSNRWSDKNLQFIVCENGVSAFVGEHAMLDGMSVRQFNTYITKAIQEHKVEQNTTNPAPNKHNYPEELFFVTDVKIESRIAMITEIFHQKHSPIEFVHHTIDTLGGALLRANKCPSKAGYQVIIQLACLIYYGYQPDSWETVSMSRFHLGRVDWVQAAQPPMARFCAAALEENIELAEKRRLFFAAVNNFVNTMTQISRGHGFKAHMHALLAVVKEDEPLPELFRDKSWQDTTVASVKTVKTDCLEGAMLQETAFLMPEPRCIFIHYEVEEEGCKFFVQAWPGRTKAICEALDRAARIVKSILSSDDRP